MKNTLSALLLALTLACGLPHAAGDTCYTEGSGVCESSTVALFCESTRLRAVPCRGAGGCVADSARLVCDNTTRAQAGDACAKSQEGAAVCAAADVNTALKCTAGVFQSQPCKGCSATASNVMCQP